MIASLARSEITRCYRLGWLLERAGWIAMAATICASVLGLFGNGWLSVETAGNDAMKVRYPRFARAHTPLDFSVEWPARQPEAVLSIERAYLDHFAIEEVRPPPATVTFDRERLRYSFRVSESQMSVAVEFRLRAEHGGRLVGSFRFDEGLEVEVRQFVFP